MFKYILTTLLLLGLSMAARAQDFKVTCPKNYVVATTENLIQVKVENVSCSNIQVRSDNGKLKKIGECTYILIPLRTGNCNISVSKMIGNDLIDIGVKTFKSVSDKAAANERNSSSGTTRTKEAEQLIVKPKIYFAEKESGELRKSQLQKQNGLRLENTPDVASNKLKLASYQVMIIHNEESIFAHKVNGPVFDEEVISALKQLRQGQMLLFTDIKCTHEGKIISLKDLIFDIKN